MLSNALATGTVKLGVRQSGVHKEGATMFAPPVAKQKSKSAEPQRAPIVPQRHGQSAVSQVQLLQRQIGNQALMRLLAQRGNEPGAPGNMARLPGVLQAKLKIGAVDDPLEHEADRVADQVMRMPGPEVSIAAAPPQVSRKCDACAEEEKLQKKPAGAAEAAGEAPASVHEVLRSPGQPLDPATRAYFEPRFGHDFSQVRVHTDARAAESAHAVNALAYTMGRDVVFGAGRYAPKTPGGQRLIAHELTHFVQQNRPAAKAAATVNPITIGKPGDLCEQEADKVAIRISQRQDSLSVQQIDPPTLQRQSAEESRPQKALKRSGIDPESRIDEKTLPLINALWAQSTLKQYVKGNKGNIETVTSGQFVIHKTDPEFETAYINDAKRRKVFHQDPGFDEYIRNVPGFTEPDTGTSHLRPAARIGAALHESVHHFQNSRFIDSFHFSLFLTEGVTQYLADLLLTDSRLPKYQGHNYWPQLACAEKLISSSGVDMVAKGYFRADGLADLARIVSKMRLHEQKCADL
jgi:hypothetical protein